MKPLHQGRTKYRAIPTYVDGIRFASKREANRYAELLLLERAGEIFGLTLQPSYPVVINDHKVCTYRGDFRYIDPDGNVVCEDVKGVKTPVYRLKKKLVEALGLARITEVK